MRYLYSCNHFEIAHVRREVLLHCIIRQSSVVVLVDMDLVDVVDEYQLVACAINWHDVSLQ